jgi:hypothetical protein
MITSTWFASFLRISRPAGLVRSSVTEYLFRISWRKWRPTGSPRALSFAMYSLRPKGVSWRSGSPPGGSTWTTSAPSSASIEEAQWPMIIPVEQSSTRIRSSASGFLKASGMDDGLEEGR